MLRTSFPPSAADATAAAAVVTGYSHDKSSGLFVTKCRPARMMTDNDADQDIRRGGEGGGLTMHDS